MSSLDFHDGNKISSLNVRQVAPGIWWRPNVLRWVSVVVKVAREGVRRALRCSETESSMVLRERRRKSRNAVVLRQNCGLRRGLEAGTGAAGAVGSCDILV